MSERQMLSLLVNDEPGVLQRICGLFTRRGFNIHSIAVGAAESPGTSRMTIATSGNHATLLQMKAQLNKLLDVLEVSALDAQSSAQIETVLFRIGVSSALPSELQGKLRENGAAILHEGAHSVLVQATGGSEQIHAFIKLMQPYGMEALMRSGVLAMNHEA